MAAFERERLGAWLLKTAPARGALPEPDPDGRRVYRERCVARGRRSAQVQPGDPVLLWFSGPAGADPTPGIWGVGRACGSAGPDPDGRWVLPLELPVAPRVLVDREQLRAHPLLAGLEVLRMPAGANPSWLDAEQWDCLQGLLPH